MEDHIMEVTQQHTAEDDTQPTTVACALSPDECNEADIGLTSDLAASSASTNSEDINNSSKNMEPDTGEKNDGQECDVLPQSMVIPDNAGSLHSVSFTESEETKLDKQRKNGETAGNNSEETSGPTIPNIAKDIAPPAMDGDSPCDEDTKEEDKTPETTTHDNQVDGCDPEDTNTEAGGDSDLSSASTKSEDETINSGNVDQAGDNTKEREEQMKHIETIGSTSQDNEATLPDETGILEGTKRYIAVTIMVIIVAILVQYLWQPKSPPQIDDVRQIDIFLRELEKLKTQFPNQRSELWNRSRIHLKRHLQTAQPTEPVSLILTAGITAERTLHCLAQGLASAFSSARNASVLYIDGASKATEDSDKVKLDIDESLQGAFEGDKPVAVIHRLEELPPGSTLIFYRYCDHENAAFKKTFLIFTVLLQEEEAIPAKIRLSDVEEMVDDHLQRKFLSDGHPVSFDRMDLDKYGGLWSRISHLILPVASEQRIEHDGCAKT